MNTPFFDAVASRWQAEIEADCSADVQVEVRATVALMRDELLRGSFTDAAAAEALTLAIALVQEDVPVPVGLATMAGLGLTHKGKPAS
jgi:hypothetical protein